MYMHDPTELTWLCGENLKIRALFCQEIESHTYNLTHSIIPFILRLAQLVSCMCCIGFHIGKIVSVCFDSLFLCLMAL